MSPGRVTSIVATFMIRSLSLLVENSQDTAASPASSGFCRGRSASRISLAPGLLQRGTMAFEFGGPVRRQLNVRIDARTIRAVRDSAAQHGVPMSLFVEVALQDLHESIAAGTSSTFSERLDRVRSTRESNRTRRQCP